MPYDAYGGPRTPAWLVAARCAHSTQMATICVEVRTSIEHRAKQAMGEMVGSLVTLS